MKQAIIEQIEFLYYGEGIEDVEEIISYLKNHEFVVVEQGQGE